MELSRRSRCDVMIAEPTSVVRALADGPNHIVWRGDINLREPPESLVAQMDRYLKLKAPDLHFQWIQPALAPDGFLRSVLEIVFDSIRTNRTFLRDAIHHSITFVNGLRPHLLKRIRDGCDTVTRDITRPQHPDQMPCIMAIPEDMEDAGGDMMFEAAWEVAKSIRHLSDPDTGATSDEWTLKLERCVLLPWVRLALDCQEEYLRARYGERGPFLFGGGSHQRVETLSDVTVLLLHPGLKMHTATTEPSLTDPVLVSQRRILAHTILPRLGERANGLHALRLLWNSYQSMALDYQPEDSRSNLWRTLRMFTEAVFLYCSVHPSPDRLSQQGMFQASLFADLVYIHSMLVERRCAAAVPEFPADILRYGKSFERKRHLTLWRIGKEAAADSKIIFKACRDGRPLELTKRIFLGRFSPQHLRAERINPKDSKLHSALQAAQINNHVECEAILESWLSPEDLATHRAGGIPPGKPLPVRTVHAPYRDDGSSYDRTPYLPRTLPAEESGDGKDDGGGGGAAAGGGGWGASDGSSSSSSGAATGGGGWGASDGSSSSSSGAATGGGGISEGDAMRRFMGHGSDSD